MRNRPLIFGMIKDYASKSSARFHAPGHKGRKVFNFKPYKHDICELSVSDSLSNPTGIIKAAESYIADVLRCRKSFILTEGATCGILAMVYAVKDFGTHLLISRGAHPSVYNACRAFGLEPAYYDGGVESYQAGPPSPAKIREAIEKVNKSGNGKNRVAAVLVTSYDYYGYYAGLSEIKDVTDSLSTLLLVDNANGAHIRFTSDKKYYAGNYAAAWVDGCHKTMPVLSQGALLNVNSDRYGLVARMTEAVNLFRTTSPSYPIMASIENAIGYYDVKGEKLNKKLEKKMVKYTDKLRDLGFEVLNNDDFYKLVINFEPKGIDTFLLSSVLEKNGIYPEMCDGKYVVFSVTPFNKNKNFKKLLKVLQSNDVTNILNTYKARVKTPVGERKLSYLAASRSMQCEEKDITLAVGCVSAENVGVYPPYYPTIVAGEVITRESASALVNAKNTYNMDVVVDDNGRERKFIKVVIPDKNAQMEGEKKKKELLARQQAEKEKALKQKQPFPYKMVVTQYDPSQNKQ